MVFSALYALLLGFFGLSFLKADWPAIVFYVLAMALLAATFGYIMDEPLHVSL